jgi:uncharacterized protein YhaN
MRLLRLDLVAYGPFRGHVLDFSRPGMHVVLGRNEAGKSTTLRAITGLLYGIDPKTLDAHVHDFKDLRIGGTLERDGERLDFVRRKGSANTLLDPSERPIDDGPLRTMLAGVTRETFVTSYGLDHATLAAGAEALLAGKGDLGESLFDASVGGGGDVQRLLAELASEADGIYRPRGSRLPLNDALKAYADAHRAVRDRQSLPEAFHSQEAAIAKETTELAARQKERAAAQAERDQLVRYLERLPRERQLAHAREKLRTFGPLAAHADRVLALKERQPLYEKALMERASHAREADQLDARRTSIAGPAANIDEEAVYDLLQRRTTLRALIDDAAAAIEREERALARTEPLPDAPPFDERITIAFERAQRLGDIEDRIATERAKLERRREDLQRRSDLPDLTVKLPSSERILEIARRFDERDRAIERLAQKLAEIEAEGRALDRERAGLAGDFAPPDLGALSRARARRDETWRALRLAETDRRALEIDLETQLRAADEIADRMIREADRVTSLARLRAETERNAAEHESAAAALGEAKEARARLERELAEAFAGTGIAPRGIAEAKATTEKHSALVEEHRRMLEEEGRIAVEASKAEAAKSELEALLGPAPTLAELVLRAQRAIAAATALDRARKDCETTTKRITTALEEHRAARARHEAAADAISAELARTTASLGLPSDAPAETVRHTIANVRETAQLEEKIAQARARAAAAETDVRAFEMDIARACEELAPDLAGLDARGACAMLFPRAIDARKLVTEIAGLEERLAIEPAHVDFGDPEVAERREAELAERIEALEDDIGRLHRSIGGLKLALDQDMRRDSLAAEAAAQAQEALARVRSHAERWARLKLAHLVLAREIERYREEHQGPLLAVSSGLFSKLTLGAFAGIKAGFDERDRPTLRCVRADRSEVDVIGLSEGTRDQLYLSLRLASLSRRAELSEPMPLVLDDILVHFDDARAAAALSVLADVADRMQVLFFTHHARLVDLARTSVPEAKLTIHELVREIPLHERGVREPHARATLDPA